MSKLHAMLKGNKMKKIDQYFLKQWAYLLYLALIDRREPTEIKLNLCSNCEMPNEVRFEYKRCLALLKNIVRA